MELSTLQDALHEARSGLAGVEVEFDALRQRKETLERLVASLSEVLNPSFATSTLVIAEPRSNGHSQVLPTRPVWQMAREVMREKNLPMTVPQLIEAFAARNFSTSPESVRVAMFRKPEIFTKLSHGSYGLVEWRTRGLEFLDGKEKEAHSEEKAS